MNNSAIYVELMQSTQLNSFKQMELMGLFKILLMGLMKNMFMFTPKSARKGSLCIKLLTFLSFNSDSH